MPEQRGQQHHRDRLQEAIRDEVIALLEGELGDPRIGLVTVSKVELPPGTRAVQVFVSVEGSDEEAEETMDGLESAKGYIRHELAERLRLHHPPDIHFHLDRSEQIIRKLDAVASRARRKK